MNLKNIYEKIAITLAEGLENKNAYKDFFNAAVFIPLIRENDQLAILFEVRSPQLSWQPGEICFPGGRIEDTDHDPMSTAVRETAEELGLRIEKIKVLGSLHDIVSPIGVRIYPFVGYIVDANEIITNAGEVAEVFTVPLDFLLKTVPVIGHMERCTRPLQDFPFELLPGYSAQWKSRKNYQVLFYQYEQYVIWGLTAQILHSFLEIYKEIGLIEGHK